MKSYKVVVAHPYKQHSFELAKGLINRKVLFKYCTTVYYKKNNLTGFLSNFLGKNAKKKCLTRCDNLIDPYVKQFCEFEGLIKLLVMRFSNNCRLYEFLKYHLADRFAQKVARFCLKNEVDAIIVYDDTSPLFSKIIKKYNPKIKVILDMSAPALPYLKTIYESDMLISPAFAEELKTDRKMALDDKLLSRSINEIKCADYYIVASEFTKKSLEYCGCKANKIYKAQYGVNLSRFYPSSERKDNDKLRVVFTGGTKQHKGISYLISAFEELNDDKVELIVIGENTLQNELVNKYPNIKFTGTLLQTEVAEILRKCDLMVFPSLGDGFGLSATEALASGCPVICSVNAGVSDLIKNNYNGYIIPIQDYEAIVSCVRFLNENRELLEKMKKNAYNSVKQLNWEQYHNQISLIISKILDC